MRSFATILLSSLPVISALPAPAPQGSSAAFDLPPLFLLEGDSTTAPQAPGGGGWGAGFLSFLVPPGTGTNYGSNGATTISIKERGNWGKGIADVKAAKGKKSPYVTIQFGHNDQKADKGISVAQYQKNLEGMVKEVKSAGGTPILVTPLTRRSFSGSSVVDNLKGQRVATLAAAKASAALVIDLNTASAKYCNAIGATASHKYNLKSSDNTHLNAEGSKVFGTMVADLILAEVPELGKWLKPDPKISAAIKAGKPA